MLLFAVSITFFTAFFITLRIVATCLKLKWTFWGDLKLYRFLLLFSFESRLFNHVFQAETTSRIDCLCLVPVFTVDVGNWSEFLLQIRSACIVFFFFWFMDPPFHALVEECLVLRWLNIDFSGVSERFDDNAMSFFGWCHFNRGLSELAAEIIAQVTGSFGYHDLITAWLHLDDRNRYYLWLWDTLIDVERRLNRHFFLLESHSPDFWSS